MENINQEQGEFFDFLDNEKIKRKQGKHSSLF